VGWDEHAASRGPGFDTLESGQVASSANSRVVVGSQSISLGSVAGWVGLGLSQQ